jgi:Ca2+-binding RTX toxin-like protein
MAVPSVRRLIVSAAALLLVSALAVPSLADDATGSTRRAFPEPHELLPRSEGATVDPLVRKQLAGDGSADVLVTLDGASALASARVASAGNSEELLRTTVPAYRSLKNGVQARVDGLEILQNYRALPILFARVGSNAQLERLAADPAVIGVEADRKDELFLTQSLPLIGQPAAASAGHTGAGTAVAVLDTGVDYTRAAFGSCSAPGPGCKVVVAQDFAPDDGMLDDPAAGRHGTNVSGIVVGVAPDTKILGLDVFNGQTSNTSTQVAAINFVISNQATYNIRAINMSLGSSETYFTSACAGVSPSRETAFANARGAGILPVVASGNDAFSNNAFHVGISVPACIPGALPVGAVYDSNVGGISWGSGPDQCTDSTTAADKITCFSQSWTSNQVLAPGALINAAGITQGGTSQATPHVAGAVAVLHDAAGVAADAPSVATVGQVETALLNSGPNIFDTLIGQNIRRLDLPAAVAALGVTPPPPPPTCTVTGTNAPEVLEGTPGNDVYCGLGGNDVIVLSGGTDVVNGGGGFDMVSLEDATGGGTVDLTAGTAVAPGISATLGSVEGAIGSPFGDTFVGNGNQNEFMGSGGNDAIDGRGGFDFALYNSATVRIRANLGTGQVTGQGTDGLAKVEGVVGGTANDVLRGNGKVNTLYGLRGNDVLRGGDKPDLLFGGPGADELFGDAGRDDLRGGPGPDSCDPGPGGASLSSC